MNRSIEKKTSAVFSGFQLPGLHLNFIQFRIFLQTAVHKTLMEETQPDDSIYGKNGNWKLYFDTLKEEMSLVNSEKFGLR